MPWQAGEGTVAVTAPKIDIRPVRPTADLPTITTPAHSK